MGGWGNFQDEHEPGTVGMEEAIGVKIEFQKYPTDADFWNNLPAQIAAKTAPDFISLTNELYLPYINDGLVVPLTSYVEDGTISCWDSIAQNLKDIWEIDGEIYGIPTHQSPLGSPSGATSTLVTFLYQQSFSYMDMGYGSAAAVILFLIIFSLSTVREILGRRSE